MLWTPFYRTDRSRVKHSGGTGLGLAICKEIPDQQKVLFTKFPVAVKNATRNSLVYIVNCTEKAYHKNICTNKN